MAILFVAFCFGAMFAPSVMYKEIRNGVKNGIVLM